MSKLEAKKLVPELRFPEFACEDEWELKPLEQQLNYLQPTNYLVENTNYSDSYQTPVLTAGKTFILGYTNEKNGIYRHTLPVVIFDDFTTATQFVDFPFKVKSSAIKILLAKKNSNIKFVYESMKNLNFQVGGTHKRHWISAYSKLSIPTPKLFLEQQKIADCLSSMDDLITANTKKLESLKSHKKGLMQKLFPAEGKSVPELRFSGFKDDSCWYHEKFGKLCTFVRGPFGGALKKDIFVENGYAVYEQSHAIYGRFSEFRYYIAEDKYNELKRFAVMANDIIMSCSGTMGRFSIIPTNYKQGVINQALLKLTVNPDYHLFFIKFMLEHPVNKEKLLSKAAGGAIKNVVGVSQLKEIKLTIPNKKEQQRIANCLSSIDDLIKGQFEKIETLKIYKKGLMKRLFPSLKEAS